MVIDDAQASAPVAPYGINFVNKNNAWCILLSFAEEVAHAAGADAYKHLYKVRTAD